MGGQIGAIAREDVHTFIGQGVQEIQIAHKQIGNAQEEEIVVADQAPGVPGQGENPPGNGDTEEFDDGMEEQVAVKRSEV